LQTVLNQERKVIAHLCSYIINLSLQTLNGTRRAVTLQNTLGSYSQKNYIYKWCFCWWWW